MIVIEAVTDHTGADAAIVADLLPEAMRSRDVALTTRTHRDGVAMIATEGDNNVFVHHR